MDSEQFLKTIFDCIYRVHSALPNGVSIDSPEKVGESTWKLKVRKDGITLVKAISEDELAKMNNPKGYVEWILIHMATDIANRKGHE